jgi:hypothetical protein
MSGKGQRFEWVIHWTQRLPNGKTATGIFKSKNWVEHKKQLADLPIDCTHRVVQRKVRFGG